MRGRGSSTRYGYRDRTHAGRMLAHHLGAYRGRDDVLVIALPRGGVPVAVPIAAFLHADLDIMLVRKLGTPEHPELAAGAIADSGGAVRNEEVIRSAGITEDRLLGIMEREREELRRRDVAYRSGRSPAPVAGRSVIVVDDGVATGATMRVALQALRRGGAASVVVATPVGPPEIGRMFPEADAVICPVTPRFFVGVGGAYDDFRQLTDAEVRAALDLERPHH